MLICQKKREFDTENHRSLDVYFNGLHKFKEPAGFQIRPKRMKTNATAWKMHLM